MKGRKGKEKKGIDLFLFWCKRGFYDRQENNEYRSLDMIVLPERDSLLLYSENKSVFQDVEDKKKRGEGG